MTKHRYSDADFIDSIVKSFSIREALSRLGLAPHGGSYKGFNTRVKLLNIDTSHFTGQGYLKNKNHSFSKKIPLEEVLIQNSSRAFTSNLKARLIKENILNNICYKCGLGDSWNGEVLVLQVDHINGDHFDHRIENLRLLCPNCHSQTPTFCSKTKGIKRESEYIEAPKLPKEKKLCPICNLNHLSDIRAESCRECYNSNRKELQKDYKRVTKINWPSIEEIKSKLESMSYLALGKELGVSDNSIRKFLKNHKEQ